VKPRRKIILRVPRSTVILGRRILYALITVALAALIYFLL
jgi:hypothetical protein